MMRSLLHLAVRAHDGLLSRWRNLWYRALGVRLTGYVWMRRVSIPDNWRNVTIEGGAGIDDGVVLRAGAGQRGEKLIIRTGTYINRYTIITAGERVEIGRNCLIGPHCFIADAIHGSAADQLIKDQPTQYKPIIIEDGVWLGAGCIVLAGVRLGAGCVIGAGSVVTQDIPAGTIAVSGSARVIKKRE